MVEAGAVDSGAADGGAMSKARSWMDGWVWVGKIVVSGKDASFRPHRLCVQPLSPRPFALARRSTRRGSKPYSPFSFSSCRSPRATRQVREARRISGVIPFGLTCDITFACSSNDTNTRPI